MEMFRLESTLTKDKAGVFALATDLQGLDPKNPEDLKKILKKVRTLSKAVERTLVFNPDFANMGDKEGLEFLNEAS